MYIGLSRQASLCVECKYVSYMCAICAYIYNPQIKVFSKSFVCHIYVYKYIYKYIYIYIYTYIYMYKYIYTYTHTHICIYIHTYIHTHTHNTHTHTYVYIYIHIYTHTHTHPHARTYIKPTSTNISVTHIFLIDTYVLYSYLQVCK